jgi:hypothetical protein
MLCIKHNEDGRFARSPVGPRAKILEKAHKWGKRSPRREDAMAQQANEFLKPND